MPLVPFRSARTTRTISLAVALLIASVSVFNVNLSPAAAQPTPPRTSTYIWYGFQFEIESGRGALIVGITPKSPAEKAGLALNDLVLSIGGTDVKGFREPRQFNQIMSTGKLVNEFEFVFERGGKERKVKLTTEGMPDEWAKIVEFDRDKFNPLFQTYQRVRNDANASAADVAKARDAISDLLNKNKDILAKVKAGFAKPDEFFFSWLLYMGFMGRGERKQLETLFNTLTSMKPVKPGDKPYARLGTKVRIAWALAAMADPDTDPKIIKAILSVGDTPELTMYGGQIISAIFEDLGLNRKKNASKMKQIAEKLGDLEVLPLLGEPCLDTHLPNYCKVLDQWEQAGKPNQMTPQDAQAVNTSLFWVNRAESLASAIGWIPERLAISYLLRVKESAPRLAKTASAGLERLFPGHSDKTYKWYGENKDYMYFDGVEGVWKFSEEAKAAGKPYDQWIKEKK